MEMRVSKFGVGVGKEAVFNLINSPLPGRERLTMKCLKANGKLEGHRREMGLSAD